MTSAGFFGKLPSHGDFVSRRLPRNFLHAWDSWLQKNIAESKAALGDSWLDVYLTSPMWRFAMSAGVCGDESHLGVMMPSVDRVGRYFPLSIVGIAPGTLQPIGIMLAAERWFVDAEELLLTVLDEHAPAFDDFDSAVTSMVFIPQEFDVDPGGPGRLSEAAIPRWTFSVPVDAPVTAVMGAVAGQIFAEKVGPHSIWLTQGSESVESCLLMTGMLPEADLYLTMLTGRRDVELTNETEEAGSTPESVAISLDEFIDTPISIEFRSAARTDTGKVRDDNEDAVLDRRDQGLWLVADGMGGHASGKTASTAIVAAMDHVELPDDLDARIACVTGVLQDVNAELRGHAAEHPESSGLGSTVAVFTAAGNTGAVVWAGDTRVYRKRGPHVEQLTADHSQRQELLERGDIASILGPRNVVTRAVGGEEVLELSISRVAIRPGDRYLLCSDGVYDELPVHEMSEILEEKDCEKASEAIVRRVRAGCAKDNASVIIIDVSAARAD